MTSISGNNIAEGSVSGTTVSGTTTGELETSYVTYSSALAMPGAAAAHVTLAYNARPAVVERRVRTQ